MLDLPVRQAGLRFNFAIMKQSTSIQLISKLSIILSCVYFSSCIIQNPKPEECKVTTEKIINIYEGTSNDIVFDDSHGDHYYINRGIEEGLNLDSLNAKVLNKTVILHLPKFWIGNSEHIAQLQVGNDTIFTEFK